MKLEAVNRLGLVRRFGNRRSLGLVYCAPVRETSTFLRRGRRTSSPPQFGQTADIASVQLWQNVHS